MIIMKNKLKPEFDFENNKNCFDYYVETENETLRGSMTPIENEDYQETYSDFINYSEDEFNKKSRQLVKRFLNFDNKKSYEEDTIIYSTKIVLFNYEKDDIEVLQWVLQLTYCP